MVFVKQVLVSAAALAIFVGGFFVLFFPEPEAFYVTSADGVLALTGAFYAEHQPRIEMLTLVAEESRPFVAAYRIMPADAVFTPSLTLTILQPFDAPLVLYRFDEERGFWQVQKSMNIVRGGKYALGTLVDIDAPMFMDALFALHEMLSRDAVAYTIELFAQPENGAPLFVETIERGACAGMPTRGNVHTFAEEERTAEVPVNDVLTRTVFRMRMEIEERTGGCGQYAPLVSF